MPTGPFLCFRYRRAHGPVNPQPPSRVVSLSPTQLQLMRCSLQVLIDTAAVGSGGCFGGKHDVLPEEQEKLRVFLEESFPFQYLLDLTSALRRATDLSDLWYREFFLELTRQIQFPISMSLPWVLTEHVILHETAEVGHN